MEKLKLTPDFKTKLDRLSDTVGDLTYLGADLSSYERLPMVAVVGTRKPTIRQDDDRKAYRGAGKGRGIVSGLAKIYPATNEPIARQIVQQNGTIISEYPADHQPRKVEFLERNRIIAALSDVVIIPEAAALSGSQHG